MELSNSNTESSGDLYYDEQHEFSEECNEQFEQMEPVKSDLNCAEMIKLADNDSLAFVAAASSKLGSCLSFGPHVAINLLSFPSQKI